MKTKIQELRRKQNGLHAEARDIHERAGKEARALTADEMKSFNERMAQVDSLQGDIEREERLALFGGGSEQRGGQPGQEMSPDIGMGESDLRQYSLFRAIRAQATGDWRQAGLEREASDAVAKLMKREATGFFVPWDWMNSRHSGTKQEQRAVTISAGSGAALIPTDVPGQSFIDLLRARLVLRNAGAVFLTGLQGNLDLPRRNTGAALTWVANGAAPGSEAGQAFGPVSFRPKTASAYVDIYRTTLNQSSLDVEMLVRDDLNQAVQLGLDRAGLHGSGSSNEPTGVAAMSGIGSVAGGTNGLAPTWANIVALETEVAIDNADVGRLAYITNTKVRGKLKTTEKATNTAKFIWNDDAPSTPVNGYPAYITNQVRSDLTKGTSNGVCSAAFFGNWGELIIAIWGGMDITADIPDNRTGTVRVAAIVDADVNGRHVESFSACLDVLTT